MTNRIHPQRAALPDRTARPPNRGRALPAQPPVHGFAVNEKARSPDDERQGRYREGRASRERNTSSPHGPPHEALKPFPRDLGCLTIQDTVVCLFPIRPIKYPIANAPTGGGASSNRHPVARSGTAALFGDFGIWGNLYQAWTDPTAGGHIRQTAPDLNAWIERMRAPAVESDFETLEALWPTLLPILRDEVGDRFLKWSVANDKAWKAGEPETSLEMNGASYRQKTFKYHSFSLGELKGKFAPVKEIATLASLLEEANCLDPFR